MNLSCLVLPPHFIAVWSPPRDGDCQEESDASHSARHRARCLLEAPYTFANSSAITPLIPMTTVGCGMGSYDDE